jgi:hypothetical protein
MKKYLLTVLAPLVIFSCKSNQKEGAENADDKKFISFYSLIKKQVEHVDSSLYSIVKTVYFDSSHVDTTFIPREQFAEVSKDFLALPDLSDPKVAARFKEEPIIYDTLINQVIITYMPLDARKEEFKKMELLATPIPGEDSRINNIIITREISNRDSFVHQKMLWQMNRSFQVTTTSQKPGKPELTTTTKVTWNEDVYK